MLRKQLCEHFAQVLLGWVCVFYLNQCLHLGSVHTQLFCYTAVLQTKLNQLGPQRSHYLIETHLGTQYKENVTLFLDFFICCPF